VVVTKKLIASAVASKILDFTIVSFLNI